MGPHQSTSKFEQKASSDRNGCSETTFQWKIHNFPKLASYNVGYYMHYYSYITTKSPEKHYFTLTFYPHGFNERTKDYVGVVLTKGSTSEALVTFSCSIMNNEYQEICKKSITKTLSIESTVGWPAFCHRLFILDEDTKVLRGKHLILKISLDVFESYSISTPKIEEYEAGNVHALGELSHHFNQMFLDDIYSDFTIAVQGKEFKVHKAVLSARSPVFKSIVQSFPNKTNKIEITDASIEAMEKTLKYVYTAQLDCVTLQKTQEIYIVADTYAMISLRNLCSAILIRNLQIDNVIDALLLAHKHTDNDLLVACFTFMDRNLRKVKERPEWIELMNNYPILANKAIFFHQSK